MRYFGEQIPDFVEIYLIYFSKIFIITQKLYLKNKCNRAFGKRNQNWNVIPDNKQKLKPTIDFKFKSNEKKIKF